ncbi:hypothetical protein BGZ63DRAFT_464305 [Mariannaea sp. PMI_226]|nr:hypothetical protein BGZ63DRAFT_464305 [Mariannaea sp. PMI_226]
MALCGNADCLRDDMSYVQITDLTVDGYNNEKERRSKTKKKKFAKTARGIDKEGPSLLLAVSPWAIEPKLPAKVTGHHGPGVDTGRHIAAMNGCPSPLARRLSRAILFIKVGSSSSYSHITTYFTYVLHGTGQKRSSPGASQERCGIDTSVTSRLSKAVGYESGVASRVSADRARHKDGKASRS